VRLLSGSSFALGANGVLARAASAARRPGSTPRFVRHLPRSNCAEPDPDSDSAVLRFNV
jgi:hypothetical protein